MSEGSLDGYFRGLLKKKNGPQKQLGSSLIRTQYCTSLLLHALVKERDGKIKVCHLLPLNPPSLSPTTALPYHSAHLSLLQEYHVLPPHWPPSPCDPPKGHKATPPRKPS